MMMMILAESVAVVAAPAVAVVGAVVAAVAVAYSEEDQSMPSRP